MKTPKQLYWQYLMNLQTGYDIKEALLENHGSPEQVHRTDQFINTCDALAEVWMRVARLNSYK